MVVQWLRKFLVIRTPEQEYMAGRNYAAGELANAENLEIAVRDLWAKADSDRAFGGNGLFDRGISDVLTEQGYACPDQPLQW